MLNQWMLEPSADLRYVSHLDAHLMPVSQVSVRHILTRRTAGFEHDAVRVGKLELSFVVHSEWLTSDDIGVLNTHSAVAWVTHIRVLTTAWCNNHANDA